MNIIKGISPEAGLSPPQEEIDGTISTGCKG